MTTQTENILTVRASGVESRLPHILLRTGSSGNTLIWCRTCGAELRQPYPGLVFELEAFAQTHHHDIG